MICQLYAPIESLQRSLYVFYCRSGHWYALRSQSERVCEPSSDVAPASSQAQKPAAVKAPTRSVWSFADNDDDDDDELMTLLSEHESKFAAKSDTSVQSSSSSSRSQPAIKGPAAVNVPGWKLSDCFEDDVAMHHRSASSRQLSQEDVLRMLDSYAEDEDNRDVVNLCKASLRSAAASTTVKDEESSDTADHDEDEDDDDDEHDEEDDGDDADDDADDLKLSTHNRASPASASASSSSLSSRESSCSAAEKLKRSVERRFVKRLGMYPRQVLRYCYDSEPLWCTALRPDEAAKTSSLCECCGAQRVFEFQLTPALFEYLPHHDDGDGDANSALPSSLEFGTCAVFVCPNSCAGGIFECAVLQTSADA